MRAVFFFNPIVWLSNRRLDLAQEIAADQLAIARQKHDSVSYGRLLVAVVEKFGPGRSVSSLSVGTMEPVKSLARRLVAMMSVGRMSRPMVVGLPVMLAATVLLGLVPWRLAAAEPKAKSNTEPRQAKKVAAAPVSKPAGSRPALYLPILGYAVIVQPDRGMVHFELVDGTVAKDEGPRRRLL